MELSIEIAAGVAWLVGCGVVFLLMRRGDP